jgi:hypothetical protein
MSITNNVLELHTLSMAFFQFIENSLKTFSKHLQ